jgi:hypothetical protein
MKKQRLAVTIIPLIMLASCASDQNSSTVAVPDSAHTASAPPISKGTAKLSIFNQIDETRGKLSEVRIGSLGTWKEDGMGGYMSITTYHEIGASDGMTNNLAYYLESDTQDNIKTCKLVLNINDPSQKQSAIELFGETADKTFKQLGLAMPAGLANAIRKTKAFAAANETFSTTLKLEKSKIDTWELKIATK